MPVTNPRTATAAARARWRSVAVAVAAVLVPSASVEAAKWHDCPEAPLPAYRSTIGATNAPFVHPGHELRIVLNSAQTASGGFSVAPAGNVVEISFPALFGEPISLEPRTLAAVTPSILSLPFPDTAAEVGRVVSGPVEIRVRNGANLVAWIDARDLVALPPATDVTALLLGEAPHQVVYAALGHDGDLWVPALFHGDPNAMPMCPGQFMDPMSVEIGAGAIPGLSARGRDPLGRIRRATLYLGDFDVDGNNLYGMRFPDRVPLVHVGGSRGVAICQLNDALDLVLRVKGSRGWTRAARSPMRDVARAGAPIPLVLRGAQPLPEIARVPWDGDDSFGNRCSPSAPISNAEPGRP
jgi:hypothetical protein